MKQYLCLLLFIFVSFFFITCKKDKPAIDQLPPATQTGANTFGCLVDGKPWTANTSDGFTLEKISVGSRVVNEDTFFTIRTHRRHKIEGIDSDLDIFIKGGNKQGIFFLKETDAIGPELSTPLSSVAVYKISDDFSYPYETDSLRTGQVNITKYDAANKIAAGTFYFTAQNKENDSVVHVTEGRFDVPLP